MKLKKALIIVLIGVFLTASALFYKGFVNDALEEEEVEDRPSTFADKLEPIYTKPARVFANTIRLDVPIISVNVLEDGTLEAPKNWKLGGWYTRSSYAGEAGNVIIDGHYDDSYGNPAAFWDLKNLKASDTLYVVDSFGRIYPYRVTDIFYVDVSDPTRLDVLETSSDAPLLTLITCGGIWLPSEGTYSKRLVVRAELP